MLLLHLFIKIHDIRDTLNKLCQFKEELNIVVANLTISFFSINLQLQLH